MDCILSCRKLNNNLVNDYLRIFRNTSVPLSNNDITYIKVCAISKNSNYNIIISNIPTFGTLNCDGSIERIQNSHIRETMAQVGRVQDVFISNNNAYVAFYNNDDAKKAQKIN